MRDMETYPSGIKSSFFIVCERPDSCSDMSFALPLLFILLSGEFEEKFNFNANICHKSKQGYAPHPAREQIHVPLFHSGNPVCYLN